MKQLRPKDINDMRDLWWNIHSTGELELKLTIDNSTKVNFLTTIYNGLYNELRDVHSRQQQVIAWGFAALTGSGLLTLIISSTIRFSQRVIFSIVWVCLHLF